VRLVVGRVGRAHGVRGDVAVEVRTDDPDVRFAPGARLFTAEDGEHALIVERSRWHAGRLLVAFSGFADRTAAEALRGQLLYRADADALSEPDAWYDHDLIGCTVRTPEGPVGEVAEVVHLPGQDLLSVRLGDGTNRLVPLVAELVPSVDLAARTVEVADVPGLLRDAPQE
jgi:16S rRNA processing protein RimM